jgi:Acetyltransferase (GNAT) domain
MIKSPAKMSKLPINLGDGLVLRRSSVTDAEALSDFNARVHSDEGPDKPDKRVWAWTHDLMTKPHPTFRTADFTIVEDMVKGQIVSAMNLIPQTWTFAGIPFKVGRPELVGTLPEYRNRGLVRHQFEIVHQWSEQEGDQVQAIMGIPYYYRQFGYEMAMNLHGGRAGYTAHIPRLSEGGSDPYRIRPAIEADIPFLSERYNAGCQRSLVACLRDKAIWIDEITGKREKNVQRQVICILETSHAEQVGFFSHPPFTWGDAMAVLSYEIAPGFTWREVTPSVIRYLESIYPLCETEHGSKKPYGAFGFWLGEEHPVYKVIPDSLPRVRKPYAWYLRVPDVPGFLRLITPELEKRLAESPMAGYTGEVKLTFYRDGVRMVFEKGNLMTVEAWKPTPFGHTGDAAFPPHTFLQLLFGYRNLDMLKASFVDCWTDRDEIHVLICALFPSLPSNVWPVS